MNIQILLAEDHQVVRQGVRALLEEVEDFEVVGETGDGLKVPTLADELNPHVLVLDLMMPGLNGLEIIRRVHGKHPDTQIVILSMHANEAYVVESVRNGAAAYVLKKSDVGALVHPIREVVAGRTYLSPPLSQEAIQRWIQRMVETNKDPYASLTPREREVFQLVAEGHTNAEVGDRLNISPRTVETHRANLMEKLNLESQAELVRYAVWRGILRAEG